jgi:hypothetical protein
VGLIETFVPARIVEVLAMRQWLLLLILIAAVGVSSLSAADDTRTTFLPMVFDIDLLTNGDFEQGTAGWRWTSWTERSPIYQYPELGVEPVSGMWAARLSVAESHIILERPVLVPLDRPYLKYWIRIDGGTVSCEGGRGGRVSLYDENLTSLGRLSHDLSICEDKEWEQHTIDLSGLAGSYIYIGAGVRGYINFPDDYWYHDSRLFVDDFRFEAQP